MQKRACMTPHAHTHKHTNLILYKTKARSSNRPKLKFRANTQLYKCSPTVRAKAKSTSERTSSSCRMYCGGSLPSKRLENGEERRGLFTLKHNFSEHLTCLSFKENGKTEKDQRIFTRQKVGVYILCESTNSVGLNVREEKAEERN